MKLAPLAKDGAKYTFRSIRRTFLPIRQRKSWTGKQSGKERRQSASSAWSVNPWQATSTRRSSEGNQRLWNAPYLTAHEVRNGRSSGRPPAPLAWWSSRRMLVGSTPARSDLGCILPGLPKAANARTKNRRAGGRAPPGMLPG